MSATAALLLFIGTAHAWEVKTNSDGDDLGWAETPIPYFINTGEMHDLDPDSIEFMINAAIREWADVEDSDLDFEYKGRTDLSAVDYTDDVNVIYFEPNWDQDESLLAVTYVWSVEGGTITAFDMAVNAKHHSWSTAGTADANDLFNTMTHEFGHSVGLAHSESPLASMYSTTSAGELIKRDLDEDDVDGMRYLYANRFGQEEKTFLGCATVPLGGLPALGTILAFGLMIRRRRTDR